MRGLAGGRRHRSLDQALGGAQAFKMSQSSLAMFAGEPFCSQNGF